MLDHGEDGHGEQGQDACGHGDQVDLGKQVWHLEPLWKLKTNKWFIYSKLYQLCVNLTTEQMMLLNGHQPTE